MKHIIYILTFLTFAQICFGQEKAIFVPTYENGDTTLWFKWQQKKINEAGLKNLTKSTDTLYFRFSSETQAIDIWTTDLLTFSGVLTNFTTSIDAKAFDRKKKKDDKFYSDSKTLATDTARLIYELFVDKYIFEIPQQDSITDWANGLDGITYFIEYSTRNSYSFKDYWTPSIFKDNIEEARRICEVTEELEELLNLRQTFLQFIYSLPHGSYRAGGIMVITTSKKKKR